MSLCSFQVLEIVLLCHSDLVSRLGHVAKGRCDLGMGLCEIYLDKDGMQCVPFQEPPSLVHLLHNALEEFRFLLLGIDRVLCVMALHELSKPNISRMGSK